MRLTPPTKAVFWISVILVVLAVLGATVLSSALGAYALWLAVASAVLLILGNAMKGF
ncbi:MAG: hypothetical protein KIS80_06015 [Anaerolineales bacterium]|nr:hypothetical protein [Anaerolineales bacterium]